MNIALDFDNTYTADSDLWDRFIADASSRGHTVWIVTSRRDTDDNRETVNVPGAFAVFTGLASKTWYMQQRGIKIDIWIDDDPDTLVRGH